MLPRYKSFMAIFVSAALLWTNSGALPAVTRLQFDAAAPSDGSALLFSGQALSEPALCEEHVLPEAVKERSQLDVDRRDVLRGSVAAGVLAYFSVFETHGHSRAEAHTNKHEVTPVDVEIIIKGLTQVVTDLGAAVNAYDKTLSAAMEKFDHRGHRVGLQDVPPADAAWFGELAGAMPGAPRKSFAARTLAAGAASPHGQELLQDMKKIEGLIELALQRIAAASSPALLDWLDKVPGAGYDLKADEAARARQRQLMKEREALHDQLMSARKSAVEAAHRALSILPINVPESDTPPQNGLDKVVTPLGATLPPPMRAPDPAPQNLPRKTPEIAIAEALPLGIPKGRRVTLAHEGVYRLGLVFAGIENRTGRFLFYQDFWWKRSQGRGSIVLWYRWRVAVDPATGQHELIQRYRPVELQSDELEQLYQTWPDHDHLWYLEPAEGSVEPSVEEVEAALARLTLQRQNLELAGTEFKEILSDNLIRLDQVSVDYKLHPETSLKLFLIRSHLGGSSAIVAAEKRLQQAMHQTDMAINAVESLAAFGNKTTPVQNMRLSSAVWEGLQIRAENEILRAQSAQAAAQDLLPPDLSVVEAKFPGLEPGDEIIVHIRRLPSSDGRTHLFQEIFVWSSDRLESTRVAVRIATHIVVDPATGRQTAVDNAIQNIKPDTPGAPLDEIYEERGGAGLPQGPMGSAPNSDSKPASPMTDSTPESIRSKTAPLLETLANTAAPPSQRRDALRRLAGFLPWVDPIPTTPEFDFLHRIAESGPSVLFLRKEMKGSNRESSIDAALILSSLPASGNVRRVDLLDDLFGLIPAGKIETKDFSGLSFQSAWLRLAGRSSEAEVLSFFKRVFGRGRLSIQQDPRAGRVLHLLLQPRYIQPLREDSAAHRMMMDRFQDLYRIGKLSDPAELAVLTDLMVLIGTPDLERALLEGLDYLAPLKSDPVFGPRHARILDALLRLRTWRFYESATLEQLAREALRLNRDDVAAWEALNRYAAIKMKDPEAVPALVKLFKDEVPDHVTSSGLIPGGLRLGFPLLLWIPWGSQESLRALPEDAGFLEKLLHFIITVIDIHVIDSHMDVTETAINLLDRLRLGPLQRSLAIDRLGEALNKARRARPFPGDRFRLEKRMEMIVTAIERLKNVRMERKTPPRARGLEMSA